MARVSISYDKDIKEQVFLVRGDERYTHATKTIIELGDTGSEDVYGFVQEIFVNVYRDVGSASIVIYDNDVVLDVITNWTSTDTGRTISLPAITWDTPHKIQAKYMGNGRCSPSMSNTLSIDAIENPHKVNAELKVDIDYNPTPIDTTTFEIEAYFEGSPEGDVGKTIELFLDGTSIGTEEIDSTTHKVEKVVTDVEWGLHTVKAVFDDDVTWYSKTVTQEVSVGKQYNITSHPAVLVLGGTASFTLRVTDFLNEPIEDTGLYGRYYDSNGTLHYFGPSNNKTDENGYITITDTLPSDVGTGLFEFEDVYGSSDAVASITLPYMTPSALTINTSANRLYKSQENTLSVNVNQKVEGVPVTLKEVNYDNTEIISSEVVATNVNGVATFTPFKGKGEFNRYFRAELGGIYKEQMLEDYVQYWEKWNNKYDGTAKKYLLDAPANLLELQNGFQIYFTKTGQYKFTIPTTNDKDYALRIERLYSANSSGTVVDVYFVGGDGTRYKLNANYSNIWVTRDENGVVDIRDSTNKSYRINNQQQVNPTFLVTQKTNFNKLSIRESSYEPE